MSVLPGSDMASAAGIPIEAFEANRRVAYSYVAALTFYIYDIILSSGEEIKYIWGYKVSTVSVLYFTVRYFSVINLIAMVAFRTSVGLTVEAARAYYFWAVGTITPLIIATVAAIFLLRIFALYNCNKRVLAILLILFLGNFAAVLWAYIRFATVLAAGARTLPAPWRGPATTIPDVTFLLAAYVPDFSLSLLFLSMTLWKLVTNYRDLYGGFTRKSLRNIDRMPALFVAFVRDGSIFFALTAANTLLKLITTLVVPEAEQAAFCPWLYVIDSYAGVHLILSLRVAGMKGNVHQTWEDTLSLQYNYFSDDHQDSQCA